ncbi:hypothetical protein AB1283_00570 [Bacillus sp. S13(2024)]|uniref:hypothetical protein n=1 Tax=Bacillus sp. S13(2024) TaxID=3162885 RepID=UPI003D1C41B3
MDLKRYYDEIFDVLRKDEVLLRYLYYKPVDRLDNPLDDSHTQIVPDFETATDDELNKYWEIVDDVIVSAPKYNDMEKSDSKPKCRLFFFLGHAKTGENHAFANQHLHVCVYTHFDFENVDRRNALICDRVFQLLANKRVNGILKIHPVERDFTNAPINYLGYELVFKFVSGNLGKM